MRESMGGTWLFGIVALFIVLFSGFIAYSISYTKAFNTKNQILNLIERNEGFSRYKDGSVTNVKEDVLKNNTSTEAQAYLYVTKAGYNTEEISCESMGYGTYMDGGYCVKRYCGNDKVYYKVTTFIKITIPVVNTQINIPITGETKAMYYEANKDLQCYDISAY